VVPAKILIVEDESVVALDLTRSLEKMGYSVIGQADRGQDAIRLAEEKQPDLVLMDIRLKGGMDGIEAANQIRARFDIPVIFLTAHADENTLLRARLTEPFGYLLKPFDERALDSNISIALYKHTAEQKLRQSEAQYRTLFEAMAQGVVYRDAEGKILSANPAAERILGMSLDQMQGMTPQDPRWKAIHLDGSDFPGERHPAWVALQTGQEVRNVIMGVHNPRIEDYIWISVNARPLFEEGASTPSQVFTTFVDITEQKKAESELRLLSQAVMQSANAIVIADPNGNIVYVNPKFEEISGYSAAEAINQNPRILKSGEQSREFYQHLWQTITAGEVWRGEFHNKRKDGSLYWEWATIAPVIDATGRLTHFIAIKEDITARKEIEEAEREQRLLAEALRNSAEVLSSTLKFEDVLERILNNTGLVVPYDAVAIVLVEDGKLRIVRHRGWVEGGWGGLVHRADLRMQDFPALQAMYDSREMFVAFDIPLNEHLPDFPETHWVRSFAGVPICSRDQVIGFLILLSAVPNFYSQIHTDRLRAFASQAAMAIENARLFEQTHYFSITDGLTGLYNSRYFYNLAKFEFERNQRYPGNLSVMMLDADFFKSVNDTYGHPVGNEVLRHLAHMIHVGLRKADVVARYGGEEFVMLMPETDLEEACRVAERLRKMIEETPAHVEGHTISLTVSIGVATLGSEHADFNALVKCADDALYIAKGAGRNQVAVWKKG
jgi:diguanylate cyclase (GGDEF)-like protein/PAS domain S-box-containing protein